jgi:hypothetical protein
MIARVRKLLEEGVPEDEPEFVDRESREAEDNSQ